MTITSLSRPAGPRSGRKPDKAKGKSPAPTEGPRSRTDFLHRTSARLVRDNDVIVIEDLNVKAWSAPVTRQGNLGLRLGNLPVHDRVQGGAGGAGSDRDRPLVPLV